MMAKQQLMRLHTKRKEETKYMRNRIGERSRRRD
jgi:hypothetical protein